MKLETNVVYLENGDRDYAERVSGKVFNSIEGESSKSKR